MSTFSDKANELVNGDRAKTYGHPFDDYTRVAGMWGAYLGTSITPEMAIDMMILLKCSRTLHSPGHEDSNIDKIGYVLCLEKVAEFRKGQA